MCPKTKLFAEEFRRILKVLCLRVLQKKLWAQFDNLCVQKWNCLLWNSDAYRKLTASKVYRKISGQIFTIYVSKTKLFAVKFRPILQAFRSQDL